MKPVTSLLTVEKMSQLKTRLQALHVQKWLVLLLLAGFASRAASLPRSEFFPFSGSAGDSVIFRSDDDTTLLIEPSVPYTFLGVQRTCFYVSERHSCYLWV